MVTKTVDLGLPSGLLWATGNIVQDGEIYKVGSETDYGAYFSWGNIEPHFSSDDSTFDDGYNWDISNTGPYTTTPGASISFTSQSTSARYTANSGYDAPHELLGGSWRMPTAAEFQELYNNTDTEWTSVNGINGRKFKKKTDASVYVFFPAAGSGFYTLLFNRGFYGYYWSSSLYSADLGYLLGFDCSSVNPQNDSSRFVGYSVRAVCEKESL